MTELQYFCN